nr:helix-turn-helix transcriptional regulator [Fredinandcohnia onubensis]
MNIGEFLRKKRKEKKFTLKQLANEIGLSQTYLSQIELGDRNASSDILEKLSQKLDVPYIELMEIAGYWSKKDIEEYLFNLRIKYDYDNLLFSLAIKASEFVEIGDALNIEGDKITYTEEELAEFLSNYAYIRGIAHGWVKDFWSYENEEADILKKNSITVIDTIPQTEELEEILKNEIKYKGVTLTDDMKEKLLKTLDIIL